MSRSFFSGPVAVKAATASSTVLDIRTSQTTSADVVTRDEFSMLNGAIGVNAAAYAFDVVNQTTNQNYVAIGHGSGLDLTEYVVPRVGSLIGIAVAANAGRSAGSAKYLATINGTTKVALSVTLDASNATWISSAVARDTSGLTVTAGQRIGVKCKSTTDFAPTSADIGVELIYES